MFHLLSMFYLLILVPIGGFFGLLDLVVLYFQPTFGWQSATSNPHFLPSGATCVDRRIRKSNATQPFSSHESPFSL
jgi:uncharacterized membrane protein YqjE